MGPKALGPVVRLCAHVIGGSSPFGPRDDLWAVPCAAWWTQVTLMRTVVVSDGIGKRTGDERHMLLGVLLVKGRREMDGEVSRRGQQRTWLLTGPEAAQSWP